ncbi:MAG: polysaccharide biosynthesis protein [Gammaproteobacteria bacterium]|nr:polysaccharide biosynthesis protein [Gammaproteobacteria bacterium]
MLPATFKARLLRLPSPAKRLILSTSDGAVLAVALGMALVLLGDAPFRSAAELWVAFAVVVLAGIPVLALQGLYRTVIRFLGEEMLFSALRGGTLIACLLATVDFAATDNPAGSLALGIVFWAFAVLGLVASRLAMRALVAGRSGRGEAVAIYGAGEAGGRLITAIAGGRDWSPRFFVDDNRSLHGRVVAGLTVAPPDQLPDLIRRHDIRRVLLALPSAPRRTRQEIIARLERLHVRVQTIPDIAQLVSGRARVQDLQDVDVADLLGREIVPPDSRLLDACIRGKSVLVTGAGGSIGSELCRQIVRLKPRRLVLLDISESALFAIDLELRRRLAEEGGDVELVPLIGSAHHRTRVLQLLRNFRVNTVYHAAAYKHVPLVEYNMLEGVHNNIVGTWHTAEAACEAGVETFVLVSTDKAVSPVNVMGASKRMAELVLQAMSQRQTGGTRFCMVRFGNVLDSSGSVVPVFREQILRGGPVTVTHRDIIRYFMTIPEAAQLVLQAGAMCQGGDVFVLDMGKPVRIADLARRMVHLMGFTVRDDEHPDGDIEIRYTGLRPAEKLYEELLIGTNVTGTDHPMILRAMEEWRPWPEVQDFLDRLLQASSRSDCERVRDILVECVGNYRPENGVDDLVWRAGRGPGAGLPPGLIQDGLSGATVTDLASRRAGLPTGT